MKGSLLYIVAYDISDDRRRSKVAGLLEDSGLRVQYSVFEVRSSQAGIKRLAKMLKARMLQPDSLRIYPVTAAAMKNCIIYGGAPLPEDGDFLVF